MAEWVCLEKGYNIGKELFRGTNMVHESSPLSEPLMATGNFTEVINDGSFLGNRKAQSPLDVKIHQNPLAEGSVKSEGNGLLKGWLVEGVANGGNFLGGSEYSHSVREIIWW